MKKLIFLFCAVVAACCYTACSNEEQLNELSNNVDDNEYVASRASLGNDYIDLLDELEAYNASFFAENSIQSRGWFKRFWDRLWNSVKADFGGFSWSDLSSIFSAGTSHMKWESLKRQEPLDRYDLAPIETEMEIDSLIQIFILDPTQAGNIHNAGLLRTFLDDGMDFDNTLSLVKSLRRSFDKLSINYEDFSDSDMAKEMDEFMFAIYDEDVTTMYNNMISRQPERKGEFEVLKLYLRNVTELTEHRLIDDYTDGYKELVKKSKLNDQEKFDIMSNLTIAPASFELWGRFGSDQAINPFE